MPPSTFKKSSAIILSKQKKNWDHRHPIDKSKLHLDISKQQHKVQEKKAKPTCKYRIETGSKGDMSKGTKINQHVSISKPVQTKSLQENRGHVKKNQRRKYDITEKETRLTSNRNSQQNSSNRERYITKKKLQHTGKRIKEIDITELNNRYNRT